MRTTLDIADDVLIAAKRKARRERKTTGQALSELARPAIVQEADQDETSFLGFRPFPDRGGVVTPELVNRLREEFGV